MNIQTRKEQLLNFILIKSGHKEFFNRAKSLNADWVEDLEQYEDFINMQRATVNAINETTLYFLEQLMGSILTSMIELVDEESMTNFSAFGFFFNETKIVIFNLR